MIFAHLIQSASSLPTDVSALETSISALERAISALESEVKALESSSAPWEYSVWVFTFLVVVGVAMELWVIRHEYRDDMEAWALAHFGVLRSPGRPSTTKLRVEIGSVLLITIGVMGELGVGIKIASINGALRGKSAELRTKGDELRSKSDQLIALINERAVELENKTAELTTANLQLEQLVNPRRLTPQQVGELESLTQFAGHTVDIESYTNDAEGLILATQILNALSKAHVGIADNRFTGQGGTEIFLGLSVGGADAPLQKKLEAVLSENGLTKSSTLISRNMGGVRMTNKFGVVLTPPTVAKIVVGIKPIR